MVAAKHERTYEDFEPPVESSEEDGCTILTIYIPGFSKEQIRVQVSSTRALRISGERAFRNTNKAAWQRFHKEFQIAPNCDTSKITAKYKGGILHVRQPLLRRAAEPQQQATAAAEKNGKSDQETSNNNNAGESSKDDAPERANTVGKEITSRGGAAGRLKEVIRFPRGGLVKLILPILVAVAVAVLLLFMFVGVEQPPIIHNESLSIN